MGAFFRNIEVKRAVIKLLILQIIFSAIIFLFINRQLSLLNEAVINQNEVLVGKILLKYPNLEKDIIKLVTKKASKEEIEKGKAVLSEYGYDKTIAYVSNPVLKDFYKDFRLKSLVLLS